jgi:hypothetical protein
MTTTNASTHRPTEAQFRRLTFLSVLAGLTPLVPVPFLDDRIHDAVKRRMVQEIADDEGVAVSRDVRDALAGVESERGRGCVGWGMWALRKSVFLILKLFRKIYRKILIFLAIKEGVDTASRAFHEGYLLHVGLAQVGRGTLGRDEALNLRAGIEQVLQRVDPRPINQAVGRIFGGSKDLLKTASELLARPFRGKTHAAPETVPAEAEQELLGGMTERLASSLKNEQGYLDRLAGELGRTTAT